ncbi:MAG: lasso peptide biosynthesis B2 protein [Gemmatimonadaceae bacterium]
MRLVRRLFSISSREWADLFSAQRSLLRAEWRMRSRPKGALLDRWSSANAEAHSVAQTDVARALEIGKAVRRVAFHAVPRSQCLVRSLAICEMLEHENIRGAIVRIGVQPRRSELEAHAWVELGGTIIGDTPEHVGNFAPLATAQGAFDR